MAESSPKGLLQAISPFPTVFSKDFSYRHVKPGLVWERIKFDENGRRFFKRVESTVGKGEIALYKQYLLFQQCFQKTFPADT